MRNERPPFSIARLLLLAVVLTLLWSMSACTRRILVPGESVVSVRTDTLLRNVMRLDSVILRDSIIIESRGDTLRQTIVRERQRTRTITDTVRLTHTDTIRVKVPVAVEKSFPTGSGSLRSYIISFLGGIVSLLLLLLYLLWRRRKGN